jgi:hypothetical protein
VNEQVSSFQSRTWAHAAMMENAGHAGCQKVAVLQQIIFAPPHATSAFTMRS